MKNIKKLTFNALLIALSIALMWFSSFSIVGKLFGLFLVFLIPLPLVLIGLINDEKQIAISLIVGTFLTSILMGIVSGFKFLFIISPLAIAVAYSLKNKLNPYTSAILSGLISGIALVGMYLIFMGGKGLDKMINQTFSFSYKLTKQSIEKNPNLSKEEKEKLLKYSEKMKETYKRIGKSFFIMAFLAQFFIFYFVFSKILPPLKPLFEKNSIKLKLNFQKLSDIQTPLWVSTIPAIAFILSFFDKELALVIYSFSSILLSIAGFNVLVWLIRNSKNANLILLLVIFFVMYFGIPVFFSLLVIYGIVDGFVNFRKPNGSVVKNESNPS